MEVFRAGWRYLGLDGGVLGWEEPFGLVPIGDFDITQRYACDVTRNVEKCCVLSKLLLGRGETYKVPSQKLWLDLVRFGRIWSE